MKEIAINTTTEGNYDEVSQPLFSVLIANYNNGKYLMEAIDSVRQQTYSNWEIVLVDDGSTDNSKELYSELQKDERIHIYYNGENKGCGYTKHQCVLHSNGEICGFIDADDALTKDALQIMVASHIKNIDASLINATYFICDEQLNVISVSENECQIPNGFSFLTYKRGISHFATFKKDFYNKTSGISQLQLRAVDHDLYYKLEEVGDVFFINRPLYYYRTNTMQNISLSENSIKAFWWHIFAEIEACSRRGLSVEDVVFPELQQMTNEMKEVGCVLGENKVRQTKTYKVGKLLLSPFKFIMHLCARK